MRTTRLGSLTLLGMIAVAAAGTEAAARVWEAPDAATGAIRHRLELDARHQTRRTDLRQDNVKVIQGASSLRSPAGAADVNGIANVMVPSGASVSNLKVTTVITQPVVVLNGR